MHVGAVTGSMPVTHLSLCLILILTLILILILTSPSVSIARSAEVCRPTEQPGTNEGLQPVLPVLWERAASLVLTLFVDPVPELAHPSVTLGVFSELSNAKRRETRDREKRREAQ